MARETVQHFGRTPLVHKFVTGAETLTPEDHFVRAAGGAYAITLPPISLCEGFYVIYRDDATAGNLTVQDQDETPNPYTSANLTAEHDHLVLLAAGGYQWLEVAKVAT